MSAAVQGLAYTRDDSYRGFCDSIILPRHCRRCDSDVFRIGCSNRLASSVYAFLLRAFELTSV